MPALLTTLFTLPTVFVLLLAALIVGLIFCWFEMELGVDD
jgi:hypothetical protein